MYVVAGVTGHVGSVVARKLINEGKEVRAIVRNREKGSSWSELGAELAIGSIEDRGFLTSTLKGARGFFTLLPPDVTAEDVYAYQRSVSDSIVAAVKASKVPHVVLLSSVGADLESGTGPIKGLHYLEQELRKTDAVLTAIRAGMFQENISSAVDSAKQQGVLYNFLPSADIDMPMVATRDIGGIAAEQLLASPQKSEVIDLLGPAYSQNQVAEKVGAAIGKQVQVINVPHSDWLSAMQQGGLPKPMAESYVEMYDAFLSGMVQPHGDRLVHGTTPIDEVVDNLV